MKIFRQLKKHYVLNARDPWKKAFQVWKDSMYKTKLEKQSKENKFKN